jgi:hypothetical protein
LVDRTTAQTDKRRHTRRKVLIPARMKHGAGWADICIRDISSRGMLVQGNSPPQRGSYVEVRRGAHIIIGKVAWAQERQFGLATQDVLPIDAIIRNPQAAGFGGAQAASSTVQQERRSAARKPAQQSHALSRQMSSLMQYGFMIMLALFFAVTFVGYVRDAFAGSLGSVAAGLDGKPAQPPSGDR